MGDVTLAVLPDQRYRDSLGAEGRVALPSGRKYLSQRQVNLGIAGRKMPGGGIQDVARIENGLPGSIGVNDTPARIDKIQAGFEPIERIGECPGLRDLQIEHSGNYHRAANVRSDQPHAMTRFVIDEAVALMAEDPEHDHAGCRSVEHRTDEVDKPLRPSPFLIKSGRSEFIVWHQVGSGDRLFDLCEKVSGCGCMYLSNQCDRQWPNNSEAVKCQAMLCIYVLAEKPRAGAAHEIGGPFDGILPKRLIDGGIVDDADQIA
jgi:hypothetical protein